MRLPFLRQSTWLLEHVVFGRPVLPAAAYAELLLAASQHGLGTVGTLKDMVIERPLEIPVGLDVRLTVALAHTSDPRRCAVFVEHPSGKRERLCHAVVEPTTGVPIESSVPQPLEGEHHVDVVAVRRRNSDMGLKHGDAFWVLSSGRHKETCAVGELKLPDVLQAGEFIIHPVLLDGCFQVAMCLSLGESELHLPVAIRELTIVRPGETGGICYASLKEGQTSSRRELEFVLQRSTGELILRAVVEIQPVARQAMLSLLRDEGARPVYIRERCGRAVETGESLVQRPIDVRGPHSPLRQRVEREVERMGQVGVQTAPSITLFVTSDEEPVHENLQAKIWELTTLLRTHDDVRVIISSDDIVGFSCFRALIASARKECPHLQAAVFQIYPRRISREAWFEPLSPLISAIDVQMDGETGRTESSWKRVSLASLASDTALKPDRTYLITGGSGAVGSSCARWLASRGARHIALAQRTVSRNRAWMDALRSSGVSVFEVPLDVGDDKSVAELFRDHLSGCPRLAGLIHAAGSLEDGPLAEMDEARLDRIFSAKARGALLLHRHTAGMALDFFVMCSSIAAAVGSAGQASYAAANGVCDGLAELRRREGLPGLSIQWGPLDFGDVGMMSRLSEDQRLRVERLGLRLLPEEVFLDYLDGLISSPECPPSVLVASVAWDIVLESSSTLERREIEGLGSNVVPRKAHSPLLLAARAAEPQERERLVQAHVRALAARALGRSAAALDDSTSLRDLGFDSLAVVEFSSELTQSYRLDRSPDVDLTTLDISQVTRFLLNRPIVWESLAEERVEVRLDARNRLSSPSEGAVCQPRSCSWRGPHVELAGLRWAPASEGPAPPTILLHGIRSHAGAWQPMAEALLTETPEQMLIAPDMRGHGLSGPGPVGHCLDGPDLLQDLHAIAKAELRRPTTVFAHSFGCTLAVLFAAVYPEHVEQLVLIEPVIPLLHGERPSPSSLRNSLDAHVSSTQNRGHPVFSNFNTAVDLVQLEYGRMDREFCRRMCERVLKETTGGFKWTWDPSLRDFERMATPFLEAPVVSQWTKSLSIPVTFVVADSSSFPTRRDADDLAAVMPNARVVHVPGTHQVHAESPRLILSALGKIET